MERTTVSKQFTSAARAGSTSTGAGSSIPKACRRSAGSSSMPRSSTRSRSTTASTACPSVDTFEGWRKQAPPGFCYAVKANRFLTQAKKLKDCEEPLERMHRLRVGRSATGSARCSTSCRRASAQSRAARQLPANRLPRDLTNVFEFRDSELVRAGDLRAARPPRRGLLRPRHARLASRADRRRPDRLCPLPWRRGQILGPLFRRGAARLDRLDGRAGPAAAAACWCYFNNDIHGHAIQDARTLKSMVGQMR